MLRAVLDANVFVSAALRPDGPPGQLIERFVREAAFEIVLSPAIADEVLRALGYPKLRRFWRGVDPGAWFEDIVVLANWVAGDLRVTGVCSDQDDDKYLAAAIEGLAAFVVTGDHALRSVKEYEGVRIIDPRTFLSILDASVR